MRIAIGLCYDGSSFEGWQTQRSGNTIQDQLERALAAIAGTSVHTTGAGRTDAGVHALAQVAHFDCESERPVSAWVRGTNSNLPPAIAVQWAAPAEAEFHARFSATARSYRYVLYNHPVRPSVFAGKVGWFHLPLDLMRMSEAAALLAGEHDFSAFRSSECQARSPVRRIEHAAVQASGRYVIFDFRANAFLHHMVRNIVGCLVQIGRGGQAPGWIAELIAARDRRLAAPTISGAGLYLSQVRYDRRWQLPDFPPMLPFEGEP